MQRARTIFDFGDYEKPATRACDTPGCAGEGLYRAPKSRDRLRDYHWFCLDHVREYNKSWNFCADLSEAQIEQLIRRDTTWDRQTRPAAHWFAHEQRLRAAAQAFAGGAAEAEAEQMRKNKAREAAATPEGKALKVLGLVPPVDYTRIKARYIELVKRHHPDANGGDKESEERLKTINQALQILKAAYAA